MEGKTLMNCPEKFHAKPGRFLLKNGSPNLRPQAPLALLQFTRLIDASWPTTLSIFLTSLQLTWLLFGTIYWIICSSHGDFEPAHLPEVQAKNNFTPCLYQMHGFSSCFLFSIETQHTVGYGIRAPTEECPEAIFINVLQCIIGFIMQGFIAVVIFTKMTLPSLRAKTILFSKQATIYLEPQSRHLIFEFRVGDLRKNHLIDGRIKAFLYTEKGEQIELKLLQETFFSWPILVRHLVEEDSPFWGLKSNTFFNSNLEIVIVLEGAIESTGQMTQARTSYLPEEVLWGFRFKNLLEFNEISKSFEADFKKFNDLIVVR